MKKILLEVSLQLHSKKDGDMARGQSRKSQEEVIDGRGYWYCGHLHLLYQIQHKHITVNLLNTAKNHVLSSSTWVLLYLKANTSVTRRPHFTDSNNAAFITTAIWRQSVDLLENRGWKNAASPLVGPNIFPKSWLQNHIGLVWSASWLSHKNSWMIFGQILSSH